MDITVATLGGDVSSFVKNYRSLMGLSQADLGKKMRVHAQYVSNVERGVHEAPLSFCANLLNVIDKKYRPFLIDILDEETSNLMAKRIESKRKVYKRRVKDHG